MQVILILKYDVKGGKQMASCSGTTGLHLKEVVYFRKSTQVLI